MQKTNIIENKGNRIFVNNKFQVFVYSPELKFLEEEKKSIELIVVSNSDFYTLYTIKTNDSFSDDDIPLIEKAYLFYADLFEPKISD